MNIGIVTGASSGLGQAFARQIDRQERLDELWLVARRADRLIRIAGDLHCQGRAFPLDLTEPESIWKLRRALEAERSRVSVLVCAAGFGKFGRAEDLTQRETGDMIDLNCRAATAVTRACLPHMEQGGRIIEICSCAAFAPLPGMNVYAATKAFLLHYTRALRWELADRGIKVTAVCPGWIKTEFEQVARHTRNSTAVRHLTKLAQRPDAVAAWALTMNRFNRGVVTCGPMGFAQRVAAKVLPTGAVMAAWEGLRRI